MDVYLNVEGATRLFSSEIDLRVRERQMIYYAVDVDRHKPELWETGSIISIGDFPGVFEIGKTTHYLSNLDREKGVYYVCVEFKSLNPLIRLYEYTKALIRRNPK